MKNKQLEMWRYLNNKSFQKRYAHGGTLATGKRKAFRPLSTKGSIHLVLRAQRAKGPLSLRNKAHRQAVYGIIKRQAAKFFIKIESYANVGNHLHLEVKIAAREEFQKFLKSITCLIARKVTGARRGHKFGRFWDGLAFTRVLKSTFEHRILRGYVFGNQIEAVAGPFARARFLEAWYGYGPPRGDGSA